MSRPECQGDPADAERQARLEAITEDTVSGLQIAVARKEALMALARERGLLADAESELRLIENEAILGLVSLLEAAAGDFELIRGAIKRAGADWLFGAIFDRAFDVASLEISA